MHSLHSYFIRPGDPSVPIRYRVDRVRDGHSFTTRRVIALQHEKAIFALAASFQLVQGGVDHQLQMPNVPAPETLPTLQDRYQGFEEVAAVYARLPQPSTSATWTTHHGSNGRTGRGSTPRIACGCAPRGRCQTTRWCTSAR